MFRTFALDRLSLQTVNDALDRAGELSGSTVPSTNLMLVCLDFLATNEFKKASLEMVQRFLKRLERALEIRIIAVGADHDLLFGHRLFAELFGAEVIDELMKTYGPEASVAGPLTMRGRHPF